MNSAELYMQTRKMLDAVDKSMSQGATEETVKLLAKLLPSVEDLSAAVWTEVAASKLREKQRKRGLIL